MFHVQFLIDDKDVVKLRYALMGFRVFNFEDKPVTNAKKGKGKTVEEEIPGGGTVAERTALVIREQFAVGAKITRAEIFDIITSFGNRPNTAIVNLLVKTKVIRKKARGVFVVLKA
jgi:hypothetical protein